MNQTATSRGRRPAAPHENPFAQLSTPVTPTHTLLLDADPVAADPVAAKREALRRYFHQTCEAYDRLFALIRDDAAYYTRHEPLRHPLIFYFAHPAVFYVNKLTAGRFIPQRLDAKIEAMMAVGVDEMSWDDLNTAHYDWPTVQEIRDYRLRVRELVDEFLTTMPLELPISSNSPAWVILMGIEHERIHLETSSVIMRMMPLEHLRRGDNLAADERALWKSCTERGTPSANEWLPVAGRVVRLGKPARDRTYGWDNEYGSDEVVLPPFRAARQLVANAEFLKFVAAGGYRDETLWPTARGLSGRPAKTCCCQPRPTGTRSTPTRWRRRPAGSTSSRLPGSGRRATSTLSTSPPPAP